VVEVEQLVERASRRLVEFPDKGVHLLDGSRESTHSSTDLVDRVAGTYEREHDVAVYRVA